VGKTAVLSIVDITQGDMPTLLGCFKYILETTALDLTSERTAGQEAGNGDGEDELLDD
jgi:hypothetical protein